MVRIEIVIDADVVLVAIGIVAVAVRAVESFDAAQPTITCNIQAVTNRGRRNDQAAGRAARRAACREIIRQRHTTDKRFDPAGCIQCRPV